MAYYKTYKGKQLGPYSYDRPPRAFTKKDLARIAKHLAESENDAMAVFVAVAIALGFGKLICDAARIVRSFISITTWLKQLGVILATSKAMSQILQWLNGAAIVAPIGVKVFVGIAISLTLVINKFVIMVDSITGDIVIAHDISTQIDEACKRVDEAQQQAFDAACDATGAACEAAKKAAEDAAFALKSDVDKAIEVLDLETYPKWWEWL